jgi:signal transduction histidine kinase/ActR/RegA family two-component response regulator
MTTKSIFSKLNGRLVPLILILSLIVVSMATLGISITVKSMKQKQVSAWKRSLPISLLSHFIASDSVPIKNVAQMAMETDLFTGIKIITPVGVVLMEFGKVDVKSPSTESWIVQDESGNIWGTILVSIDNNAWISPTFSLSSMLGAGLLSILFVVFILIRTVLKREFSILDRCIADIEKLADEMIQYKGSIPELNTNETMSGIIKGVVFSSREHQRMSLLVNRLVGEVATLAHGIRESERKSAEIAARSKTAEAIAQMTTMLAHDVRKPFSMLKTGIALLQSSLNNPNELEPTLHLLVTEVERSYQSVNGLLSDVMEIGSSSTSLRLEAIAPEALIDSALSEVFRFFPNAYISMSYNFRHSSMAFVQAKKFERVITNLVGNAIQAMGEKGAIWINTQEDNGFIEFCIGNANSFVSEEDLPFLFEAFYTSNKKGGTGLGLAIAKKIVSDHGGTIWCQSRKGVESSLDTVEFYFTVPKSSKTDSSPSFRLPSHSKEIIDITSLVTPLPVNKQETEINVNEESVYKSLVDTVRNLKMSLGILIVDDESIYRAGLARWIDSSQVLVESCAVYHASNSAEALHILRENPIHLVITDLDLGPNSLNGLDLLQKIRDDSQFLGLAFLHSNQILPNDQKETLSRGADGFLPKPMAKGQLWRILIKTAYKINPSLRR